MSRKKIGRGGLWFGAAVALGILAYAVFANRVTGSRDVGQAVAPVAAATASTAAIGSKGHHPAPRSAAERETVMAASHFGGYPRIANVYRAAAEVPDRLDGVYCYCHCAEHAGHYSLLSCFASEHAAACDVCLSEGETVFRLARNGASLDLIRDAIDQQFGG